MDSWCQSQSCEGGQGGGGGGIGGRRVWEVGEERAGNGIPKVTGTGRNWEKFCAIVIFFNRNRT